MAKFNLSIDFKIIKNKQYQMQLLEYNNNEKV